MLALVDQFIQGSSDTDRQDYCRVPTVGRGHHQVGPGPRLGPTRLLRESGADSRITEWASKITATMQQRYICRKIGCQAVVDKKHWLRKISPSAPISEQHGRCVCPHCLNPYRPWIQQPDLIPAQKGLVVAASDSKDRSSTPTCAATRPGNTASYFLYLAEWGKKDEGRLLQNLKLVILNIQQEITDQDGFNHFLTETLKDVADKNQPLPYFTRETWPRNSVLETNARKLAGANPPYRVDLLPAERHPDKFFREEFMQPAQHGAQLWPHRVPQ